MNHCSSNQQATGLARNKNSTFSPISASRSHPPRILPHSYLTSQVLSLILIRTPRGHLLGDSQHPTLDQIQWDQLFCQPFRISSDNIFQSFELLRNWASDHLIPGTSRIPEPKSWPLCRANQSCFYPLPELEALIIKYITPLNRTGSCDHLRLGASRLPLGVPQGGFNV